MIYIYKPMLTELNRCYQCDAVVPLPDFFESADFLEPISRKSGSVNRKIGKSVTPNLGNIKIGSSRISEGPLTRKSGNRVVWP